MVDGHETFVKKSITSKEKREGKDTLARTGLEVVRSGRCDNIHLWFLCGADDEDERAKCKFELKW